MEERYRKIVEVVNNGMITQLKWIEVFNNLNSYDKEERDLMLRNGSNILWYIHERYALKSFFVDEDLNKAKYHFYTCSRLDEFQIKTFNANILEFGLNHLSYALLSDDKNLIDCYANLTYNNYNKSIANGTATATYVLQCLIKDNWEEYEKAIVIMKSKTIKKYPVMNLDVQFFEALADRNKAKIEEILAIFVTPKIHSQRNKLHTILNEFISHPALGYAKLAWIKGLDVEVNSPYVPKELLPIKPVGNYENEYAFLIN